MRKLLLVLLMSLLVVGVVSAQESGVSDERFARLARGINLPYWFWYAPETEQGVRDRLSDDDFQLIRGLGLTVVRVPIDLGFLLDESQDDLLNPDNLALLDEGIDRIFAHDLAVIIDLHSTSIEDSNNSNYSGALEDPEFVEFYLQFWRSFAAHLTARDPERLFIEPMNEPVFEQNTEAWPPIQERLLAVIRESAPEHTLIATGARWSSRDTLMELKPLADPNIIYNFHYYEPFLFTHQGATWSWYVVQPLRDIPYPSSPEAVQPVLDSMNNEEIAQYVRWYGEERWEAERIDGQIAEVSAWAEANNVRLITTEFGAFSEFAPQDDRVQWTHDIRASLEAHGIGWVMWEYDSSFGLVMPLKAGKPILNVPLAEALGLNT